MRQFPLPQPARVPLLMILITGRVLFAQDTSFPGVRNGHAMVYHPGMEGLFLFAGADERQVTGESWLWSDRRWKKLPASGPAPRTFASMVYMARTNEVLLFGGNKVLFGGDDKTHVLLNDTWIFRDNQWVRIEARPSPPARSEACMAYDAVRDEVILFGGFQFSADGKSLVRLGDTWKFKDGQWIKVDAPGPSPRSGSALAYHAGEKKVILFGGNFPRSAADKLAYNGAAWCFDGLRWDSLATEAANVYNTSMTFHPKRKSLIRFGGWNGSQRLNDTWEFRDGLWKKLSVKNPPRPRNHTVLVYDAGENGVAFYGGHDGDAVFGDLWILRKNRWRKIFSRPERTRVANDH